MIDFDNFNWLTALETVLKDGATAFECRKLGEMSAQWPTCACGELCKTLPHTYTGQPLDADLYSLGTSFAGNVGSKRWVHALAIFHQIEARSAVLLGASVFEGLKLTDVVRQLHIITGPNGQCMCGVYKGEVLTCRTILGRISQDILKANIIAETGMERVK